MGLNFFSFYYKMEHEHINREFIVELCKLEDYLEANNQKQSEFDSNFDEQIELLNTKALETKNLTSYLVYNCEVCSLEYFSSLVDMVKEFNEGLDDLGINTHKRSIYSLDPLKIIS